MSHRRRPSPDAPVQAARSPDQVRAALSRRLATLDACSAEPIEGRGIVICAGGARMYTNAYVLIFMLRRILKSDLPIEVWHFGEGEITPSMRRLLADLRADAVDAEAVLARHPANISDGWQLKAYAIMWSRFAEVLLLDADQVPVRDPVELFQWPPYEQAGAVFWPDIVDIRADNPVWPLCGLEPRRMRSFESGQVLVDKRRHWPSLQVALHLNEEAEAFYRLIYGDKDTFLIAWLLRQAPFHLMPHAPLCADFGLIQRDLSGEPLFQHRTGGKWVYGSAGAPSPAFRFQSECEAALHELQAKWSGRVFRRPGRSSAAQALEAQLDGAVLRLSAPGRSEAPLELLPDGEIGEGRTADRRHWYAVDGADTLSLILSNGDRETAWLRQDPGGWRGRSLPDPAHEIVAAPGAIERVSASGRRTLVDDLLQAARFDGMSGPHIPADLRAALRLIARTDPGVADRLREIGRDSSAAAAATLSVLADEVEGRPHRARDASFPPIVGILSAGYIDSHLADP